MKIAEVCTLVGRGTLQSRRRYRGLSAAAALAAVVALALPGAALAKFNYSGNVVGVCVVHEDVTYNVVARANWPVRELEYDFGSGLSGRLTFADPDTYSRYFLVPPGPYTVVVGNPAYQGSYSVTAPECLPAGRGMTWRLVSTNGTGTIRVGCAGCDPYLGDTPCTDELPLLCIKKEGAGFPLPKPASVDVSSIYNQWAGGVVGTTRATVPPTTRAGADSLCAAEFGADWRVAEFHDGWGWYFQTYGGIGDPNSRFWVDIDDQPNAVCWQ